jgi:hypothetical protein
MPAGQRGTRKLAHQPPLRLALFYRSREQGFAGSKAG